MTGYLLLIIALIIWNIGMLISLIQLDNKVRYLEEKHMKIMNDNNRKIGCTWDNSFKLVDAAKKELRNDYLYRIQQLENKLKEAHENDI